MSQIIFCLIGILAIIIFSFANKNNNRIALLIGILILSFAAGLRKETVGIDTYGYSYSFIMDFPYTYKFREEGFRFISRILMQIFDNPTWLFFIYSFVTNMLIIDRLWDFRKESSFEYMTFLYFTIHYINTMNIMRQYIAVAILFWGTKYLEKKLYKRFIFILLIASSIHVTALLGSAYLFIYIWNNATSVQKKRLFFPIMVLFIISIFLINKVEAGHINNYLSGIINNVNYTFFYRICIFILCLCLQKVHIILYIKQSKYNTSPIRLRDNISLFYLAGLISSSLGLFFNYLSRVGVYFLVFEMVFWGKAIKYGKSKQISFVLSAIYALYVFSYELIYNGSGIFPYSVHWF